MKTPFFLKKIDNNYATYSATVCQSLDVKVNSHQAKANAKAKIPFDDCRLFSDLFRLFFWSFRFRLRFRFGVIRPLEWIALVKNTVHAVVVLLGQLKKLTVLKWKHKNPQKYPRNKVSLISSYLCLNQAVDVGSWYRYNATANTKQTVDRCDNLIRTHNVSVYSALNLGRKVSFF